MFKKINKSKLNLNIDIIMFVVLMAIAGIGFMIKYVLVPGFKRTEIYGKNVELYFGSLDRHQWGNIHLILSFILLFLLLLHILFHWKMIVCIFKSMVIVKTWRIAIISVFVIISLVFGVLPLFVKPEIQDGILHHNHQSSHSDQNTGKEAHHFNSLKLAQSDIQISDTIKPRENHKHEEKSNIELYGYMTLDEVSTKFNIPANELALCIHIPNGHNNEKLGRLRKHYSFHMNDLRDYIETSIKQKTNNSENYVMEVPLDHKKRKNVLRNLKNSE